MSHATNSSSNRLLVLDPNIKDLYCHHREPDQYAAGIATLKATFDEYYVPPQVPSPSTTTCPQPSAAAPLACYGSSFLLEAVQSFQHKEKSTFNPQDGLKQYLGSVVESTDNVVA